MRFRTLLLGLCWLAVTAAPGAPQSVLERTPNLSGGWTGARNSLYFNFLHRFTHTGAPLRQVINYPTFLVAYRAPVPLLLGVQYATRSDIVARYPNEWELFARYAALTQEGSGLADASLQAGYNVAAESFDGELALARRFGRVRALGVARAMSNAYGGGAARFALGAGASVRVSESIALAADVTQQFAAGDSLDVAWGAALQLAIPFTPHTLSLQASNTNTASVQGATRAGTEVRYGFEFTVPLTLSRYLGRSDASPPVVLDPAAPIIQPARISGFRYLPATLEVAAGTTIVWTNEDDVSHTVTATDRSWDSGLIEPGATWRRTFTTPGTYEYFCLPHPRMRGTVVVRAQ